MERPSSSGFIAAAVVLLAAFVVWLCAQMAATDPANETILLTIGGALVLSVLALALGSWSPGGYHRRSRARSSVGERSLHTREVAGSKPAAPMKSLAQMYSPGWVLRRASTGFRWT